jgi:hypothetical protein
VPIELEIVPSTHVFEVVPASISSGVFTGVKIEHEEKSTVATRQQREKKVMRIKIQRSESGKNVVQKYDENLAN